MSLDHGAGGGKSHELIVGTIARILGDTYLGEFEDSAVVDVPVTRIAVTTDSFVVDPIFFGNGDIGKVAVAGTVNDLAVSGARPLFLTLALIVEDGFPVADLERILTSFRDTALAAEVKIVAGDTKVVRKGEADRIYLNTTGVGVLERGYALSARRARAGDDVIVTGLLGDHTIHLLSMREGLGFESRVPSDCAALNHVIAALLDEFATDVRCLRDITRGGLGTVLNEIADLSGNTIRIREQALPIRHETAMAADMLGVDVMYLANEGNLCAVVDANVSARAVDLLRGFEPTSAAAVVGRLAEGPPLVEMDSRGGGVVTVAMLYGAQLPRLC